MLPIFKKMIEHPTNCSFAYVLDLIEQMPLLINKAERYEQHAKMLWKKYLTTQEQQNFENYCYYHLYLLKKIKKTNKCVPELNPFFMSMLHLPHSEHVQPMSNYATYMNLHLLVQTATAAILKINTALRAKPTYLSVEQTKALFNLRREFYQFKKQATQADHRAAPALYKRFAQLQQKTVTLKNTQTPRCGFLQNVLHLLNDVCIFLGIDHVSYRATLHAVGTLFQCKAAITPQCNLPPKAAPKMKH